jgi:hypothetical protein
MHSIITVVDVKILLHKSLKDLKIAFWPTNTILQQLTQKSKNNNPCGIYQLKCNSCNTAYVRQSGTAITVRHKEHLCYIRNNNPMSAYATHILHNRHEFGPAEETLKLFKPCNKGTKMNCWEALYMSMHYKQGLLIPEQQVTNTNPLFDLAIIAHELQTIPPHSNSQSDAMHTHTHTHTHTHHRVSPDLRYISDPHPAFHYIADAPINSPILLPSRICRQTLTTHIISTFEPLYVIPVKYRLSLPDDGSYVIRNMLE